MEKPGILGKPKFTVASLCIRIQSCCKKCSGRFIIVGLDSVDHPLRTRRIHQRASRVRTGYLDLLFFGEASELADQLFILRLALCFWGGGYDYWLAFYFFYRFLRFPFLFADLYHITRGLRERRSKDKSSRQRLATGELKHVRPKTAGRQYVISDSPPAPEMTTIRVVGELDEAVLCVRLSADARSGSGKICLRWYPVSTF